MGTYAFTNSKFIAVVIQYTHMVPSFRLHFDRIWNCFTVRHAYLLSCNTLY